MCYTTEEIRQRATLAVVEYNSAAEPGEKISRVSLFGSYANGKARDDSDVDLLVSFDVPVVSLFTLARALEAMESKFDVSVDLVQDPMPKDALLVVDKKVLLYEAA